MLVTQRRFDNFARNSRNQIEKSVAAKKLRVIFHNDQANIRALPSDGNGQSGSGANGELRLLPQPNTSEAKSLSVLVADDHPIVREGLAAMIDRQSDMRVLAQAANGREALDTYFAQRPDVALLDVRMPVMDGVEAVGAICEREPNARLVIVTTYQSEEDVYRALRAGAQGYILKSAPVEEIVGCIHAVGAGKTWIPPEVGAMLANRVADQELTPRETEVLHAVTTGKSNKEIGVAFDISEATVKVHVTHILEKLKVTGRTEAINVAVKRGLVRIEQRARA
jgi:two-component system, NarL family, response regulator